MCNQTSVTMNTCYFHTSGPIQLHLLLLVQSLGPVWRKDSSGSHVSGLQRWTCRGTLAVGLQTAWCFSECKSWKFCPRSYEIAFSNNLLVEERTGRRAKPINGKVCNNLILKKGSFTFARLLCEYHAKCDAACFRTKVLLIWCHWYFSRQTPFHAGTGLMCHPPPRSAYDVAAQWVVSTGVFCCRRLDAAVVGEGPEARLPT